MNWVKFLEKLAPSVVDAVEELHPQPKSGLVKHSAAFTILHTAVAIGVASGVVPPIAATAIGTINDIIEEAVDKKNSR